MTGIQIVKPDIEFITPKYFGEWAERGMELMEECGRVSHKSEGRIEPGSAAPFLNRIAVRMGHESILEHFGYTVCFIGSRSMSHQLVRHRLAAITQESQRYCDYSSDKKAPGETLKVIMPPSILGTKDLWGKTIEERALRTSDGLVVVRDDGEEIPLRKHLLALGEARDLPAESLEGAYVWCEDQIRAYKAYLRERARGIPSEDARYHLPNSCKTEVYTTYNFRMWRHVLGNPVSGRALNDHAQWEIKMITMKALEMFREHLPDLFKDLGTKMTFEEDEWRIMADFLNDISVESLDEALVAYDMPKTARRLFKEKLAKMGVIGN